MRNVTSCASGTTMHCGTNANWVATMRTVTRPFVSTRVPRLGSVNSPVRCRVFGSIRSRFDGGLRCNASAANNVSPKMMTTKPLTAAAQRSSERTTSCSVHAIGSADHTARQIDEQVDQEPGDEEQPDGDSAQGDGAGRHRPKALELLRIKAWRRPARRRHIAHWSAPPRGERESALLSVRARFQEFTTDARYSKSDSRQP